MMIDTRGGGLNSRFVKLIKHRWELGKDDTRHKTTVAIDDEGTEYEVYGDVEEFNDAPCIAATPPLLNLLVLIVDEGETYEHRYPIVGWKVPPGEPPQPIAIGCNTGECGGSNWLHMIVLPNDGGFQEVGYDGARYSTIEEARQGARSYFEIVEKRRAKDAAA